MGPRRPGRHAWRLAAACVAAGWSGAGAWSRVGHERVARIAQELLQGRHKDQIRTMIHGDLVELAGWEQTMTEKFKETDALHWHRQEPEWTCGRLQADKSADLRHLGDSGGKIACDGKSAESGSLFCALAYFFEHFAHDALLRAYPEPKDPIKTPAKLAPLQHLTSAEQTPAHYLRWLAILVGDLHQPLHWLRENDYGRSIKLIYQDQEHTLLSFWEDYLPRYLPPMPTAEHLKKEYENRAPGWWDKLPTELFRDWAKETAEVICDSVYAPMEVNHADGTRQIDQPFKLEEEIFQRWRRLAQDMTTLGGQRLAFVLNDIVEHKKHKAAHREGRGRGHRKHSWTSGFVINLVIAAVVVPGLLLLLRLHAGAGGPSILRLFRQHLKM